MIGALVSVTVSSRQVVIERQDDHTILSESNKITLRRLWEARNWITIRKKRSV